MLILAKCSPFDAVKMDPEWGGIGEREDIEWDGGWMLGVGCIMTPAPIVENISRY